MNKHASILVAVLLISLLGVSQVSGFAFPWFKAKSPKNGNSCMICTLVAAILENLVKYQQEPIDKFIDNMCANYLPAGPAEACQYIVDNYGSLIIAMLEAEAGPDDLCLALGLCTNTTCRLFPKNDNFKINARMASQIEHFKKQMSKEDPWQWLQNLINRVFQQHEPLLDIDGDNFSTLDILRGANWRGKDCNDYNSQVRPGRKTYAAPAADYNCNGISGSDPVSGRPYKDLFCANSGQMGVAVLGGSACSHFSIRYRWVDWLAINRSTYDDLVPGLLNEVDWPHWSWATGYAPQSDDGEPVDSIYLRMRARNLCNHRDFQNIGINGDSSNDIVDSVKTLVRNQTSDYPLLVVYSPLGDDICNMDTQDPFSRMTTVPVFKANVLQAMEYLDTVLPAGSHVQFVGVVNGSILWNVLHSQMHPFGVTYAQLYTWLYCIQANPCTGWLNPNDTVRALSSQHAKDLSDQYKLIVQNYKFKNFDMAYVPFPLQEILDAWTQAGGLPAALIEPVDGFHPSQQLNALLGPYLYNWMVKNNPSWFSQPNPYNAQIQKLFGNQGGY